MRLLKRQPDGSTVAQHLQAAAAATGQPDAQLLQRVPAVCAALWEAFCELASCRPSGMGPQAIPGAEIESWQRLHGVRLSGWEIETLRGMDRAALAAMADKGATA